MQKEIGCIPESTISKEEKSHKIDVNPFKSIVNNINKDKIENRTRVTHAHGDHVTTYRSLNGLDMQNSLHTFRSFELFFDWSTQLK